MDGKLSPTLPHLRLAKVFFPELDCEVVPISAIMQLTNAVEGDSLPGFRFTLCRETK
jgi:hypothetical protein